MAHFCWFPRGLSSLTCNSVQGSGSEDPGPGETADHGAPLSRTRHRLHLTCVCGWGPLAMEAVLEEESFHLEAGSLTHPGAHECLGTGATCLLPHAKPGHRKCQKWLWIQTDVSRSGWAHSCIEAGSSPDLTGVRAGAVLWTGPVLASPGSWPRGLCWVVIAGPRWSPCGMGLAGGVLGKLTQLAEPHRGAGSRQLG